MKTKRYLLVILIVSMTAFLYFKVSKDEDKKGEAPKYNYQVKKPQVISYEKGEKRWDIKADNVLEPKIKENQKEKIILNDIRDGKLFEDGEIKYHLEVKKIIYFSKSEDMNLRGNIKLISDEGEEIRTERLDWKDESKEFLSDDGVNVKLKSANISAKRMKMDTENEIMDFDSGVEMTFEIEGVGNDEE